MKKLFSLLVLVFMFSFVAVAQNVNNDDVIDKVIAVVGQNMIKKSIVNSLLKTNTSKNVIY